MFIFLILILLSTEAWSLELPAGKQDVFARKACPAFLTFFNVAYMAGVTVELPCHCKPQQVQSVVWFFRKHGSNSEETRALTDHHGNKLLDSSRIPHGADLRSRFFIRLFSLLIFRAGVDDSGIYICGSAHGDYFYAYDLDIQEVQEPGFAAESKTIRMTEGRGPRSGQLLYQVFTAFHPWSRCDRCGVPGEQVRVGLCYVHSRFLHVRYRRANATVASCGSGAVPEAFSRLKRSRHGARLEVRSCHETCPHVEAPPPSKPDKFMVFSGSRTTQTEVKVSYLNHPADHILTLGCPDAKPGMAVAWDRGSEPIYRLQSSADSRIHIDAGHHLVFNPATYQDSAVYYCWLQGHRVAEIHLLVYASLGTSHSITTLADLSAAVMMVLRCYGIMTAVFCLLLIIRVGVRLRRDQHMD
ncbi:Ig-like V-type domain-containing protein FAM187A [Dunckerocampus dactyliophorus]|uniref:Ig-like V-type domain-containing protein FAM187A n=1 Tax=Dunckerocampus dactyliophorus TaxID=161453 RepID=UPI00240763DC|nr:Ig-like V-type domain-containing protein FAM187A [Dunckerocampus dactyliophorus]XP_054636609.1 Ig-like V-type domain-containing protein FAM187A [Dunckerocampus dactyliophorus]